MGSLDCYCAICGGPFCGIKVSEKPRTAAFLKKRAEEVEDQRLGREGSREGHHGPEDGDDEDDEDDERDSHERHDEEHAYDQDVISVAEVEWAETLHVLACNHDSEEPTVAFVSGPGTYNDCWGVSVESGDDPNAEDVNLDMPSCYHNLDAICDAIFPIHWCCYEILTKCLTGSFDDDRLDKDILYSVMQGLSLDAGTSLRVVDYGDAARMQGQNWETLAGYEFLVSHPLSVPGASELISSMFGTGDFKPRSSSNDLGRRVRDDPFAKTSYDLIYRISKFMSDNELANLVRASWPVHALLRNNHQFWWQRLKTSFFPWFFELRGLLEQDQTLLQTNNAHRIFQWAESMTRPKKWLAGPLVGVSNRRRIWSVCEQLGGRYWPEKEEKDDTTMSDEERLTRRYSESIPLVTISSPEATKLNPTRKVYWAKSWSEVQSESKTLETFWNREGSLVGIALTPDGQKRRLLGMAGSDDGMVRESISLGAREWVTDLIIHIPVATHITNDQLMTSPKGLAITLNSGRTSGMGDTSQCHMQRFLSAAPEWYITGINGTTGFVMGNLQLTQLGLVQAQLPDFADYSEPPHQVPLPVPSDLGRRLLDEDYSHILGRSIRDHQPEPRPWLRLMGTRVERMSRGYLHQDLIPQGALIWAKDLGEHQALRRLTGRIVSGGKADAQYLCGISAEYEPATGLTRRVVGVEKTGAGPGVKLPDLFEPFDIDGPGGEVVTQLEFPLQPYPRGLRFHTNRGRTCSWGETDVQRWDSLKPPTGEAFVGILVTFGGLDRCRGDIDETIGPYEMSAVAGLSRVLEPRERPKPV